MTMLSSPGVLLGSIRLLQDVQCQSQHDESSANPLGSASQLGIQRLGLVSGQEGVTAADDAGQTGVLTGLEQNSQNQSHAAQQLQNSNKNKHIRKPPNRFTVQLCAHVLILQR